MQNAKLRCSLKFTIPHFRGHGFTLIELIIVLLIIGIAAALVGIVIHKGAGSLELSTFTKDVSATLRYARSHAIAEKRVYSLIIWKDQEAYGLYNDLSLSKDIEEITPVIYKTIPQTLQIIFDSKTDYLRIDFFPQGTSTGGIIEIKNQKGKTFFIIVNKITGSVKVKKSQNEK